MTWLTKIVFPKKVFILLIVFLKQVCLSKSINEGSHGSENAEIMEMFGFGPSNNKTDILLDQNKAE